MHRAATLVHLPTCVIDLANRRLIRPDGEERLSGKEVELIAYFHARLGEVVTREALERDVWKFRTGVHSEAVPVAIRRLRSRIEADPKNPRILVTGYGQGWRMLGPEDETPPAPRSNPVPESPVLQALVGRTAALADLEQGWTTSRVQTLVGPGGVGKTTLAKAASPPGALFIDLQHATTVAQCLEAARSVLPGLHLADIPDAEVIERLHRRLAEAPLVVLDNAEQAVEEVARVVPWFPRARLLVTSRVRLGIPEERVVPLRALDADDACALFRRRYEDAGGRAVLEPTEVLQLVQQLDRLPLAIELIAPRARVVPLPELVVRLGGGLDAIPAGKGRAPRHASMRACLQWSWGALPETAQDTLRAAATFCTTFDLADLEAVLERDPVDDLEVLLDASMIDSREPGRYAVRILLRSFVADQGSLEKHRPAHARVVLAHLESIGHGIDRVHRLVRWVPELQQIVLWAQDPAQVACAALAIHESVEGEGLLAVARDALKVGIERCTDPALRARLEVACVQAIYVVDPQGALARLRAVDPDLLDDPLEYLGLQGTLARLGHGAPPDLTAWAAAIDASASSRTRPLNQLALSLFVAGELEAARATIERAVAQSRIEPNLRSRVRALRSYDFIWSAEGSGPGSIAHLREALELAEAAGMRYEAARCRANLAVEAAATDRRAADRLFLEVELENEALGDAAGVSQARANRAINAWFLGEYERAVALFAGVDGNFVSLHLRSYNGLFEQAALHALGRCDTAAVEAALNRYRAPGTPYELVLAELMECLVLGRPTHTSPAEAAASLGYHPPPVDIASCVALLEQRARG